jgi:serine/threonine protein kinase
MFYYGIHNEYTVLAMDLLGPSVEDLLNFCGRKFSLKTISMIMEQVLRGIEALHNHSLIHRDLKPDSKSRSTHRNLSLIFPNRFSIWSGNEMSYSTFN